MRDVLYVPMHSHEATGHQPKTFYGVCLIFSRKTTIVEVQMFSMMVVLCGMNPKSRITSEPPPKRNRCHDLSG